ncbi:hypothetical protein PIB30_098133 [Stylosanthes scabra]|uniref:Uncharacterized protein n=1 Tax=Stylosanthes scabra TaxID=79078 RepID=A0ABU6TW57_9FABA|nr:hypothetical protein [Stylosanthes scabra]
MEENETGENDESNKFKIVSPIIINPGLIKTAQMHVERQGKSNKKAKKTSSSSSESEYIESSHDSESDSDDTFSLSGSDSEQTMSDSMVRVQRRTRSKKDSGSEMDTLLLKRCRPSGRGRILRGKEEDRKEQSSRMNTNNHPKHLQKKRTHHTNNTKNNHPQQPSEEEEPPHHQHHKQPPQQPPQEEEPQHEQPPPKQPYQPSQQQQQQQEYIDISSCSDGEPEPTPITVLVPKAVPDMVPTTEKMIDEAAPSQSVLEVEVIDISSGSEDEHELQPDPIRILVPKVEEDIVTLPSARLITEVLMSMGQDKGEVPEPNSPPDPSISSFSLNLDWSTPLVTEEL